MKISNSKTILLVSSILFLCFSALQTESVQAQGVNFETDEGWILNVTGQIPVFVVASEHEGFSSDGDDQFATRIRSGFNPANITFHVEAPEMNGIRVKGIFQINHHLQGASVQNDGLFEGRIADIQVSGDFGTLNIGKGFGVFNSSSIGDAGSAIGVGRFAGPDAANAALGRIGSGYTYANFNPRLIYTTPDLNGFSAKIGLINPEKPSGASNVEIQTATPRLETQANYVVDLNSGNLDFWVGAMAQNVEVISADFDYNISGWDVGARLSAGGFGLTGAYSQTNGVGADGLIGISLSGDGLDQADVAATQWYGEATYDINKLTLGVSYGEGSQDAEVTPVGSSPDITNELAMVFGRYAVTNNLKVLVELQDFASEAQNNYQALIVGMRLNF
ncbi:MAG: porin [Gracilimonas sp.]|uniref:porin n=1 Tax=Gracilimonas sp. TaxID=1974203 RepID=UPI003752B1E1|nr:porin [Gracilimonas sp.]